MRFESSPRKGLITAGSFVSASLQGRQQRQCAEGKKEAQVSVLPTAFLFWRNFSSGTTLLFLILSDYFSLGFFILEDPVFPGGFDFLTLVNILFL